MEKERRGGLQAIAFFIWLRRHVESDPALWFLESDDAHVLEVAWACSCADGKGRRRVRVVLEITKVDANFLNTARDVNHETVTAEYSVLEDTPV